MNWNVATYPSNMIDYTRLILLMSSVFFKGNLFALLYGASVSLDFFDGYVARLRNETSRLGAALDMIIDRVSTMLILMKIAFEKPDLFARCSLYSIIDFVSHFLFFLVSAYTGVSHKTMSSNFLLDFYYNINVLRILCLGSELCFIVTYLSKNKNRVVKVLQGIAGIKTFFHVIHFYVAIQELSKLPPLDPK